MKWINIVDQAINCMDKEYCWRILPEAGGYYDQDSWIWESWKYIRECYIRASNDDDKIEIRKKNSGKSKT